MTTDAPPTTLTEWLLTQLDADEAVAAVLGVGEKWVLDPDRHTMDGDEDYWDVDGINGGWVAQVGEPFDAAHIALHDPAHVLAQIAAVRAVVTLWADFLKQAPSWAEAEVPSILRSAEITLRALAQPYAGRAGWDEAWTL